MRYMKTALLPVLVATVWISVSEFIRNELLFKHYWVVHYHRLGLVFPSSPVNGMVWGVWSLCYAVLVFVLSKKFSFLHTCIISFFAGFVLMWLVAGNLGVLPAGLLVFAVPLAALETAGAVWLVRVRAGR